MSRYRAELLGGDEWVGWSGDSARLADIIDMTDLNTRASAQQKAKFKQIAARPDPETETVVEVKANRVADMDWGSALNSMLAR